jgi:hypothetical protein
MKSLLFVLLLVLPLLVSAQTITLGPISKTTYCVGDTLYVPYSANGTFASDNHFFAQLIYPNGTFSSLTQAGAETSGIIAIALASDGSGYRIRIASTDPYVASDTSVEQYTVSPLPNANPVFARRPFSLHSSLYVAGLIGDSVKLDDLSVETVHREAIGSRFKWAFDQDANIHMSFDSTPSVSYSSEGIKTGTLTVTNSAGCARTTTFHYRILGCNAVISSTAHIVTSTERGDYPYVWVKAGGDFTPESFRGSIQTMFVEPGGAVHIQGADSGHNIYYLKQGAIIKGVSYPFSAVVLSRDAQIISTHADTFYCDNVTFDYSQISNANIADENDAGSFAHYASGMLSLRFIDNLISCKLTNLLATTILTREGTGELDIDLSSLPSGVYFVEIRAGGRTEMRKIVR